MADRLRVDAEKFDSPYARLLRGELEAELIERYGGDLEPGEKPSAADVAVFLVARGEGGDALGCGALRELGDGAVELKHRRHGYHEIPCFGAYAGSALSRCFERRLG
jgi:putative acetyltransferase